MAKTQSKQFKKFYSTIDYLEKLACTKHDQGYMHNRYQKPEQFLERTREFIKLLGNPHRGFKFIHVTGTAGKGSTVSYLHNILYKNGFKVGSFTSPYATSIIENIKVDDKLINPDDFVNLTEKIQPIIKKMGKEYKYGRSSYFEILFGIAILYFKKMKCDYVVLEVGCGGRYDAGNLIPKSISAITNIGLDHTNLLGNTLSKIAYEKAGIIKPNTNFFTTETRKQILKLFKDTCKEKKAKFHLVSPKVSPPVLRGGLRGGYADSKIAIHQQKNIALATAIVRHIGIKENIIKQGINHSKLPCRFEIIQKPAKGWSSSGRNPLIILDGAHNPDKIQSVVHNLKNLTYDRLYIIFASAENKDAKKMIKKIAKPAYKIIFTKFDCESKKAYTPKELYDFAKDFKNRSIEQNAHKALKTTLKKLKKNDILLITGSFYLAGELRKHFLSEEYILKNRTTI